MVRKTLPVALVMAAALFSAGYTALAEAASSARGTVIVMQDQTALRGAPRDSAPVQATLWRGEALEVRAERADYLQVWDHQRERGGYVHRSQLHAIGTGAADAEAYRVAKLGKVNAEQMAIEGALITRHPLLIQKALADKLSDKIQVIIAPPPTDGGFIGRTLLGASKPAADDATSATTKEQ